MFPTDNDKIWGLMQSKFFIVDPQPLLDSIVVNLMELITEANENNSNFYDAFLL